MRAPPTISTRSRRAPRLAAGQMHLQHAERRRLAEHARPGRGIELVVRADRAPADWSNRDSRAGSDASARPEGRAAHVERGYAVGVHARFQQLLVGEPAHQCRHVGHRCARAAR